MKYILLLIVIILVAMIFHHIYKYARMSHVGALEKEIHWINKCEYTSSEIDKLITPVYQVAQSLQIMTQSEWDKLRKIVPAMFSDDQIKSAWHSLVVISAMKQGNRLKIAAASSTKLTPKNLSDVARKFRVSPIALVREYEHGRQKHTKLASMAEKIDATSSSYSRISGANALEYEKIVAKKLHKLGIEFRTQDELTADQVKKYGRAVITPDFLLDSPTNFIVTNESHSTSAKINWIDAKNYIYLGLPFSRSRLRKQAEKYVAEFGPGAFLFHYGFLREEFPHVLMLC